MESTLNGHNGATAQSSAQEVPNRGREHVQTHVLALEEKTALLLVLPAVLMSVIQTRVQVRVFQRFIHIFSSVNLQSSPIISNRTGNYRRFLL